MQQSLYLLLGSNRGNRLQYIHKAELLITERLGSIEKESSIYETAAWGNIRQATFLNKAIMLNTNLSPEDILVIIKKIETDCGRVYSGKWNEREIDIDILLLGNTIFNNKILTIPHAMLHVRKFALVPLAEIAGNEIHAVFKKNISEILKNCNDMLEVNIFEPENEL
jgi:2-amino-4-hydroxy-6-hydroxymethyldihydropteridine diphosphokinase